ncbi:2-C-methyl-D-erythritol 2,4-cyclodiphosphate synthase [Xylariaceae sp. FL1019]|nr:2-C-methyl-D-erythritol 2,4-cyclodiphosphate synthase [Xylariaceae sp. FL1019]
MKICVLQLANGPGSTDSKPAQTESLPSKHEFHSKFIDGSAPEKQIDAAVAENYDFYLNLLLSSTHNPQAAKKANQYFESLNLPSSATQNTGFLQNKNDFYAAARRHGSPPVPGDKKFPMFVKPAKSGLSRAIGEQSICQDENELKSALERISKALDNAGQSRKEEAQANGVVLDCCSAGVTRRDDVVAQEYVEGIDVACTVIIMCGRCVALTPVVYNTGDTPELLSRDKDQALYERIQKAAVDASIVSGCGPNTMGCNVDFRVQSDGSIFVISVNTRPPATESELKAQALVIENNIPGGLSSLHDIFIANHLLRTTQAVEKNEKLAETYDTGADNYEKLLETSEVPKLVKQLVEKCDYTGAVFDIACGTGIFGQLLIKMKPELAQQKTCKLFAFDIAPGMLKLAEKSSVYEGAHNDTMEETLLNYRRYAEQVDHVVCLTALQFLRPEVFTFWLTQAFMLTNKSITFTVNHAPDSYNTWLSDSGYPHMHAIDHSQTVEGYGVPKGWKLVWKQRELAIKSPMTGDNIYQMVYHFERENGSTQDILLGAQVAK